MRAIVTLAVCCYVSCWGAFVIGWCTSCGRQGWHALEKLRAALATLRSPWRLCRSMDRMSLPPDHVMTLPCSRQSVPGFLFRTLPYSRRLWTPASASRSARPSRRLPGTRTRGLRVFTPTSTAAWTLTRFGDSGDASMVSPNTTCSSLSRSTHSALQATVASCSAGSPSRGAYGRFSKSRHHRDRRVAPRTLDSGSRDVEDDALSNLF